MGECGTAEFCACEDSGTTGTTAERSISNVSGGERYFNSGFMVFRPNRQVYEYLRSKIKEPSVRPFADQDLLNDYYRDNWKILSKKYNTMHISGSSSASADGRVTIPMNRAVSDSEQAIAVDGIVAIHEKFWKFNKQLLHNISVLDM